ncbi:MAG: EF-hand domain-containing protein [Pseudomonadota bacterium]
MQKLLWMTTAAAALGLAGAAAAASFSDVDANDDGVITQEEFNAAYPEAGENLWMQIDANGDGEVTEDEHQAALDAGALPAG